MPKPEWRDPAKERDWRRWLARWQQSGQSIRDFCRGIGVAESSFYFWRREIARRDREKPVRTPVQTHGPASPPPTAVAGPAFVPVRLAGAAATGCGLELVLPNGRVLRVHAGFDAAALRQLLAVLEEWPC